MEFLNKFRITVSCLMVSLIPINCQKFEEISDKELSKFDGIYDFEFNNSSFEEKFDETKKIKFHYIYNCAEINTESKQLIIQLTKNTEKVFFDIKKVDDTHWVFISKQGIMDGDLGLSYGQHREIGLSFTDVKGRKRTTSISAIGDKSLEACIERNNANYDNEIQFVKEQNNDGEK
ncbi:hypothetical protein LPTSP4_21720 [Leptospira ryugenii]|uniref:Uncharacterized protein n=1 Tax=Leptospira ryugenii TaxID=1917863 RepID=A0A2P2E1H8_9LEPT|nr:hypothetical protein [Leptospira ryugenii]GBF50646.1 hypothetical protein LPTSP4_21720 [Leptospira ryugenii]